MYKTMKQKLMLGASFLGLVFLTLVSSGCDIQSSQADIHVNPEPEEPKTLAARNKAVSEVFDYFLNEQWQKTGANEAFVKVSRFQDMTKHLKALETEFKGKAQSTKKLEAAAVKDSAVQLALRQAHASAEARVAESVALQDLFVTFRDQHEELLPFCSDLEHEGDFSEIMSEAKKTGEKLKNEYAELINKSQGSRLSIAASEKGYQQWQAAVAKAQEEARQEKLRNRIKPDGGSR